jgi:TPR repeat protein
MYLEGEGVKKNQKEAIKLLEKSAAKGNKDAREKLAALKPAAKSSSKSAKTFSQTDTCRVIGQAAACGFNTKSADKLIRKNFGGSSMSEISAMTQYQSCVETVQDIAKSDLQSKTANFTCSGTKKELQALMTYLKNMK